MHSHRLEFERLLALELDCHNLVQRGRVSNASTIEHNRRRSKLIMLRRDRDAYRAMTGDEGIDDTIKMHFREENGQRFYDPVEKAITIGLIKSGDELDNLPPCIVQTRKPPQRAVEQMARARELARTLRARTPADWLTALTSTELTVLMRKIIARWVWWDYLATVPTAALPDGLRELAECELSTMATRSYSADELAVGLWLVGFPPLLALQRANPGEHQRLTRPDGKRE